MKGIDTEAINRSSKTVAKIGLLTVVLLTAGVLPYMPSIMANDSECTTTLPVDEYDEINVPSGNCVLQPGTIVNGDVQQVGGNFTADKVNIKGQVQVQGDSQDTIVRASEITGGVQIQKSIGIVLLEQNDIGGNVQIQQKEGGDIFVTANSIGNGVQVQQNTINEIDLSNNSVVDGVQETDNTSTSNTIGGNTIGGNLQCDENFVPPTDGGNPNTVSGSTDGQCEGF